MDDNVCELVVVRHGQTVANRTGVLQGQLDTPLDDCGIMQAQAIAERLKDTRFDAAYSSDLMRTMFTAQTIAAHHRNLQIMPAPALREWHLGVLQGMSYDDLRIQYPEILDGFKRDAVIPEIPGGESQSEFQQRISDFMDLTAEKHPGKRILLVSHGGAIQRMFSHVTGALNPENIRPLCGNTALSIFQKRPAGWQLITWNDTCHLAGTGQHATLTF